MYLHYPCTTWHQVLHHKWIIFVKLAAVLISLRIKHWQVPFYFTWGNLGFLCPWFDSCESRLGIRTRTGPVCVLKASLLVLVPATESSFLVEIIKLYVSWLMWLLWYVTRWQWDNHLNNTSFSSSTFISISSSFCRLSFSFYCKCQWKHVDYNQTQFSYIYHDDRVIVIHLYPKPQ